MAVWMAVLKDGLSVVETETCLAETMADQRVASSAQWKDSQWAVWWAAARADEWALEWVDSSDSQWAAALARLWEYWMVDLKAASRAPQWVTLTGVLRAAHLARKMASLLADCLVPRMVA